MHFDEIKYTTFEDRPLTLTPTLTLRLTPALLSSSPSSNLTSPSSITSSL